MFENEVKLHEGERMDFVTVVTPNFAHFAPAIMALENEFHVVIDKPITFTLEEAKILKSRVGGIGLMLALTYTYSGYPAVKEARERIRRGDLGKIRKVFVEYPQLVVCQGRRCRKCTGLLSYRLETFRKGRLYGRYWNTAREENAIRVSVYGEKGGLE